MSYKRLVFILAVLIFTAIGVHGEPAGYIVKFKITPDNLNTELFEEIHAPTGVYKVSSKQYLADYDEYIEYVEPNEVVKLCPPTETVSLFSVPNDEHYNEMWALDMVKAPYFWNHETYGNDVIVGVIDSGCYPHDDLRDNLLPGWDFLNNKKDTSDSTGHGTHVSGIIAASMNSIGVVGVAPKAKIVPLKCFNSNSSTTIAALQKAIYAAVDKYSCKVINMSWGTDNPDVLTDAINYASSKGAILIAAAGNEGSSLLNYPAAYPNVIGVAAVTSDKSRAPFSNYNSSVHIAAPGKEIISTSSKNSYEQKNGTSMAAPHIAGIAALALSADSSITHQRFASLLSETAEDLYTAGYDNYFGYGLVNAQALMNKIFENIPYYVSPVNTENSESHILIRNNTEQNLNAKSIYATYNQNELTNVSLTDISLLPGEWVIRKTPLISPVHFLWDSINNAKPLTQSR